MRASRRAGHGRCCHTPWTRPWTVPDRGMLSLSPALSGPPASTEQLMSLCCQHRPAALARSGTRPAPRHQRRAGDQAVSSSSLPGITVVLWMMAMPRRGPLAACPGKRLPLAQISQIRAPADNAVVSQPAAHSGGSTRGPHHGSATFCRRRAFSGPALRQGRPRPADARGGMADGAGLGGRLPGSDAERFGVGPAVVLGQNLAEVAGPVRDGAVAELAARDRKLGNGHRKAAGT